MVLDRRKADVAIPQLEAKMDNIINNNVIFNKKLITVQHVQEEAADDFKYFTELAAGKFEAVDANILYLKGYTAEFDKLTTKAITTDNLQAEVGKFGYANIEMVEATEGKIKDLSGELSTYKKYVGETFTGIEGDFETLSSGVADIKTLLFGSATGTTITTEFANTVVSHIGTSQIHSGMIEDLAFDKITGFDVNTTNVTVHSEDGKSQWKDNTIQISDADRVRVQIGKDASGDYSMYVWDKTGKLMFDALGLTGSGIQREIIRNDMVAKNAAIDGSKLNIESVFREMDDSTYTLTSNHLIYDGKELDLFLGTMSDTVTEQGAELSSQGTQITAIQGELDSKIWQQDIDTATGDMNTKYSNITQDLSSFKTTVGSTYATKSGLTEAISGIDIGGRNLIFKTKTSRFEDMAFYSAYADNRVQYINVGEYGSLMMRGTGTAYMAWFYQTGIAAKIDTAGVVTTDLETGEYRFTFDYKTNLSLTYIPAAIQARIFKVNGDGTYTNLARIFTPTVKSYPQLICDEEWHRATYDLSVPEIIDWNSGSTACDNCIVAFGFVTGTEFVSNQYVQVKCAKLEKGNKATDWSPAPEDTDSAITETKTIATQTADEFNWIVASGTNASNFTLTDRVASLLSTEFDIDALTTFKNSAQNGTSTVINGGAIKTNSITAEKMDIEDLQTHLARIGDANGKHVLIDSDSLDIKMGDDVVASFGADAIYLGKNKYDAVIDLCSGVGTISTSEIAGSSRRRLSISSKDEMELYSESANRIQTKECDFLMNSYECSINYSWGYNSCHLAMGTVQDYGGAAFVSLSAGGQNSNGSYFSLDGSSGEARLSSDKVFKLVNNTSNKSIGVGVGSDGTIKGIHDTDANKWMIYSNDTDLYLGPPKYSSFRPYYRPGDTIDIKLITAGHCMNSGKDVYFTVPLPKPILSVSGMSAASTDGFKLWQNGQYTHGSSSSVFTKPSSYTIYLSNEGKSVTIKATFGTTTNAISSCPISIHWRGTIKIPA